MIQSYLSRNQLTVELLVTGYFGYRNIQQIQIKKLDLVQEVLEVKMKARRLLGENNTYACLFYCNFQLLFNSITG